VAVEQAPRSELDVDGHRIRAAAFGVGVSFVGAALIVAAVTGSVWATLAVLIAGAVTTSSVHRAPPVTTGASSRGGREAGHHRPAGRGRGDRLGAPTSGRAPDIGERLQPLTRLRELDLGPARLPPMLGVSAVPGAR